MIPRNFFVKARVRTELSFNRGPNGTAIASADYGNGCDEIVVSRILAAASHQRLRSMGEFGLFARPYLKAGYQREVTEAHRRYFLSS